MSLRLDAVDKLTAALPIGFDAKMTWRKTNMVISGPASRAPDARAALKANGFTVAYCQMENDDQTMVIKAFKDEKE